MIRKLISEIGVEREWRYPLASRIREKSFIDVIDLDDYDTEYGFYIAAIFEEANKLYNEGLEPNIAFWTAARLTIPYGGKPLTERQILKATWVLKARFAIDIGPEPKDNPKPDVL